MIQISQRRFSLIGSRSRTNTRRRTQRMFGRVVHRDVQLRLLLLMMFRSTSDADCWITSGRCVAVGQLMLMRWMRSHVIISEKEAAWRRLIRLAARVWESVGRCPQMIGWLTCTQVFQHAGWFTNGYRTHLIDQKNVENVTISLSLFFYYLLQYN